MFFATLTMCIRAKCSSEGTYVSKALTLVYCVTDGPCTCSGSVPTCGNCDADAAYRAMERVRERLAIALESGRVPPFTVSFGIATHHDDDTFANVVNTVNTSGQPSSLRCTPWVLMKLLMAGSGQAATSDGCLRVGTTKEGSGSCRGPERIVLKMLMPIITTPARYISPPISRTQYMGTI